MLNNVRRDVLSAPVVAQAVQGLASGSADQLQTENAGLLAKLTKEVSDLKLVVQHCATSQRSNCSELQTLAEMVTSLDMDVEQLTQDLENFSARQPASQASREASLVIRKVPEPAGETEADLKAAVVLILQDLCNPMQVRVVSRIGKPRPDRPRLVLVQFENEEIKRQVKRQGAKLAGTPFSMDHALTKEQLQHRAAQWPLIEAAKKAGMKWMWSDLEPDKLLVRRRRPHEEPSA